MSDFFDQPPKTTYFKQTAEFHSRRDKRIQQLLETKAAHLKEVLDQLRQRLQDEEIPPNVIVKVDNINEANRFRGLLNKIVAAPRRYSGSAEEIEIGTGWVIAQAHGRYDTKSIALLNDGRLILGGKITEEKKGGKIIRRIMEPIAVQAYGHTDASEGLINLNQYPFHPLFTEQRNGYAPDTGLYVTDDVAKGLIQHYTPEANVDFNLGEIEEDIRRRGRQLLRIN